MAGTESKIRYFENKLKEGNLSSMARQAVERKIDKLKQNKTVNK